MAVALAIVAVAGFLGLLRALRLAGQHGCRTAEIFNQPRTAPIHACQHRRWGDRHRRDQQRIRFLNGVAEKTHRLDAHLAEASGKSLVEVFHIINERTRAVVENPCTKVFREGIVVGLANHTLLIAKDGTECPIDDSAAPIRDQKGNIFGAVLVFRDATQERRDAENRERLAAIVESATDAIIGEDTEGNITSWNQASRASLRVFRRRGDRPVDPPARPA